MAEPLDVCFTTVVCGLGQQQNVVGMELLPQSVLGLCLLSLTRLLSVTFPHDGEAVVNHDLKVLPREHGMAH